MDSEHMISATLDDHEIDFVVLICVTCIVYCSSHERGNLLPSRCVQCDPLSSQTLLLGTPYVRLMRVSIAQVWGHCRGACICWGWGEECKIINSYSGIYACKAHLCVFSLQ